jgi:hypothetical protein
VLLIITLLLDQNSSISFGMSVCAAQKHPWQVSHQRDCETQDQPDNVAAAAMVKEDVN